MKDLKVIIAATRPQFFPAILTPITLGTAIAWCEGKGINIPYYLLSLLAGVACHGGMNLINDYFDHRRGTDDINLQPLTPYAGGSRVIQRGLMSPEEVYRTGKGLIFIACLIGLYLASNNRLWLIPVGLFGLLTGFFYSAPPLFLSGRGLGEVVVALNFGTLSVVGAYYIQSGNLGSEAVIPSIPISLLVAAILFINEFPDYWADRRTGKATLVVGLGRRRARIGLYLLISLTILSILFSVIMGSMPPLALLTVLPALYGFRAARGLWRHFEDEKGLLPYIRVTIHTYTATGVSFILLYIVTGLKGG